MTIDIRGVAELMLRLAGSSSVTTPPGVSSSENVPVEQLPFEAPAAVPAAVPVFDGPWQFVHETRWVPAGSALPVVDLGPPAEASYVPCGTSRRAASRMSSTVRGALERAVFQVIQEAGHTGATDDEIQIITGLAGNTQTARRNGLVQKHKIRDSGQRRRTRSGAQAIVWVTGEGIPVVGAPNRRAPARPENQELRDAAALLGIEGYTDAVRRVAAWLEALANQ